MKEQDYLQIVDLEFRFLNETFKYRILPAQIQFKKKREI